MRPAKICSTLIGPSHMKKIASSRVSSHPPPNREPSLMLRIDTCELPHTNSYVVNQSYEFVFTTSYPLVSPHICLQIKKGCSKPEAYCSSPLGGPKYKEKKTREARLSLESMFRIIDHLLSRSPIGNLRCFHHQHPISSFVLSASLLIA